MSSFIKKNISIICMLFLLSGPIIDFVTGVMLHIFDVSLTLGLILRILFLFFIIPFIFYGQLRMGGLHSH